MDTTTNKPGLGGDGRGRTSPSPKSRPENGGLESSSNPLGDAGRATSEISSSTPSSSAKLLGADGEAIPIDEGFVDGLVDRGRDLGRQAGELGKRVSSKTQEFAEDQPVKAMLVSLGVGVVLGAVIGALLSRD
ncbi:MAG: hypothetical protein M3R62_10025 [Acidobacteriota bacterium]|nr:hypothetical protein [Acidobacteriota bacterium]